MTDVNIFDREVVSNMSDLKKTYFVQYLSIINDSIFFLE